MKTALYDLAHARAGDKGDVCNVGVIARRPEYWPVIQREVTAERVKSWFGEWCKGDVERYELPNLQALNFVLRGALDGGGWRSRSPTTSPSKSSSSPAQVDTRGLTPS